MFGQRLKLARKKGRAIAKRPFRAHVSTCIRTSDQQVRIGKDDAELKRLGRSR